MAVLELGCRERPRLYRLADPDHPAHSLAPGPVQPGIADRFEWPRAFDYVAGLYFFHQKIVGHPISIYGPLATYWLLPASATRTSALLDGYQTDGTTDFRTFSYAAFGEVTWRPARASRLPAVSATRTRTRTVSTMSALLAGRRPRSAQRFTTTSSRFCAPSPIRRIFRMAARRGVSMWPTICRTGS